MQGMIVDWIGHNAANLPNKTATVELPSGRSQTYGEMHDRVGRIAAWLVSLGVERGDRVGVLALNSQDMLDIIFTTWRSSASTARPATAGPSPAGSYGHHHPLPRPGVPRLAVPKVLPAPGDTKTQRKNQRKLRPPSRTQSRR